VSGSRLIGAPFSRGSRPGTSARMPPQDPLVPGSRIELIRPGSREPFATAELVTERDGHLRLEDCRPTVADGAITLRYWDERDDAWVADAAVTSSAGHVTATLLGRWTPAVLRRSARILAGRTIVDLLTLGGDGAVIRRVRGYCLDISSTGCRIAGTGGPPEVGDLILITSSALPQALDARIVRSIVAAFGSWEAGVAFLPHDASDIAAIVSWRDEVRENGL
jgi:hypothetical protein